MVAEVILGRSRCRRCWRHGAVDSLPGPGCSHPGEQASLSYLPALITSLTDPPLHDAARDHEYDVVVREATVMPGEVYVFGVLLHVDSPPGLGPPTPGEQASFVILPALLTLLIPILFMVLSLFTITPVVVSVATVESGEVSVVDVVLQRAVKHFLALGCFYALVWYYIVAELHLHLMPIGMTRTCIVTSLWILMANR